MYRILVTDGMDQAAVKELKDLDYEVVEQFYKPEELKEEIKKFDCIVVRSATKIDKEIIDASLETKKIKLIIRGGVGVDNIDVEYAIKNGIKVANTPKASSTSVAELTIGQIISLARYTYISNVTMRQGQWNKKIYRGIEISGKTLGLIGFGRIARKVAQRAYALGMNVIYNDIIEIQNCPEGCKAVTVEELISTADFISLHMPGTNGKPIIGKEEFEKMKNGVYILNLARGGIIDEEALIQALDSGKVAAAALDVFEEEPIKNERLYKHEKIALTPHIGGSTIEAQKRIGEEIVSIIKEELK